MLISLISYIVDKSCDSKDSEKSPPGKPETRALKASAGVFLIMPYSSESKDVLHLSMFGRGPS